MMSEISSASSQQVDYMTLLVTQLQNQNPLEPMDNQDMAAQMAQFSQLDESEKMNANLVSLNATFSQVLQNSELEYAKSMVGSMISFEKEGYLLVGTVDEVVFGDDGICLNTIVSYEDDDGIVQNAIVDTKLEDVQSVLQQR